jgi:hypothetical protein
MYVFSIDIPFKGSLRLLNMRSKLKQCLICTAVSLTPLCMSQWCQWLQTVQWCHWHHCAVCSRVRFPYTKQCVELFTKMVAQLYDMHSSVIVTAVTCTAVSLTPQWQTQRYIIDTAVQPILSINKFEDIPIQKGFNPWIMGPEEVVWFIKTRGRKSRVRVPLMKCLLNETSPVTKCLRNKIPPRQICNGLLCNTVKTP